MHLSAKEVLDFMSVMMIYVIYSPVGCIRNKWKLTEKAVLLCQALNSMIYTTYISTLIMPRIKKINQKFVCSNCGHQNPPAIRTCRNHCRQCLFSLHVDLELPGDRASLCHGLLEPVGLEQNGKKGFMILHKCLKCGYENRNLTSEDDNSDALIKLSQRQNLSQT